MTDDRIATQEEWQAERDALLAEEKELTHRGDDLAEKRRTLPWVPIEKEYELETADGKRSLTDLFDGRSQLLIYHFMFGPTYEAGCPTCSSMVDGVDGLLPHLHARDVSMLLVSRAPMERLQAYKQRMGWSIPWVSSANNDFSFDVGASLPVEQVRENMPPESDLPPIAGRNAAATGTDVPEYIAELPAMSAFMLEDGAVYQTYGTT